ncbi:sodium- and chloride-dependent GABA transporter ine-like isoform X1 [Lytechinus variegatus]|uniref:sodium- and chloride-dependent GABA transporter ine-like isoform X1 n=2 Tax=Lytechinus variegatus TaxID=7654 RepID=UPI001BB1EF42|nr:sodium- and chloride-dependent GABA transporter ine-like isoform X1 [Lytechinus variegatus]
MGEKGEEHDFAVVNPALVEDEKDSHATSTKELESNMPSSKASFSPLKGSATPKAGYPGASREKWGNKAQFILACVGYAVGLGNVWRFPYLCYKSGGGAFLIPYFLTLFLTGIPLLLLEFGLGQYIRHGPVVAFKKITPLFKGTGVATVMITFLLTTYYNVIMTWALFYLFASFQSVLPWSGCNNTWNTDNCWSQEDYLSLGPNETKPNGTNSSTQEYFDHRVLQISGGIDEPNGMRWELFGLLLLAWILVYFCLFKGVATSGKVVYFTATFPYLVLIVLLINGALLDGAGDGMSYLFKPRWELLKQASVWEAAAAQNFNSIGIAFGSMIALSSYNEFKNRSIVRDTLTICGINSFTSIFASCVIFCALGYISKIQGANIDDVVVSGPGLVFVTYPVVFNTMPAPQLWAVLFFLMLVCLGIDSQFAMVEVVVATFSEGFPKLRQFYFNRKEILVLYICVISFLLGLPNITRGGMYFFQIMDWYTAVISLFFVAIAEAIAVCWVYGGNRLAKNIEAMTGSYPNIYFRACWLVISPVLILAILIFTIVDYEPVTYGKYIYPAWCQGLGWCVALLSIMCMPVGAIHTLATSKGSMKDRLLNGLKADFDDETHIKECEGFDYDIEMTSKPPSYDMVVGNGNVA